MVDSGQQELGEVDSTSSVDVDHFEDTVDFSLGVFRPHELGVAIE